MNGWKTKIPPYGRTNCWQQKKNALDRMPAKNGIFIYLFISLLWWTSPIFCFVRFFCCCVFSWTRRHHYLCMQTPLYRFNTNFIRFYLLLWEKLNEWKECLVMSSDPDFEHRPAVYFFFRIYFPIFLRTRISERFRYTALNAIVRISLERHINPL